MTIGKTERERRWSALRGVMAACDLDAVVIRGSGDDPHTLYFADVLTIANPNTVFALTRSGEARLFLLSSYDSGEPIPLYRDDSSVLVERVCNVKLLAPGLAPWLADHGARRIGIPELALTPPAFLKALTDALPGIEMVEVGPQLDALRWVKSEAELQFIRRSATSADKVWAVMRSFFRPGRTYNQLLSDIDRFLVEEGCDAAVPSFAGSFLSPIRLDLPVDRWYVGRPMEVGDAFNLEISPRYQGYFTQLTSLVSIGPVKPEIRRAYEAVLKARAAALPHVRAGVQSKVASDAMVASLAGSGYEPCNPDIGHLMGLLVTEPRVGAGPFEFKAGMVLVVHPIIREAPHFKMLMRGDTYLVTEGEPEALTTHSTDILEI